MIKMNEQNMKNNLAEISLAADMAKKVIEMAQHCDEDMSEEANAAFYTVSECLKKITQLADGQVLAYAE